MNKVNFYLESRLAAVKKRAAEIAKHNPEGAYRWALDSQVKYKRPGYSRNDTPNHYSDAGDLYAEKLDKFDAVPIQDISRHFSYSGYYADNFQHELIKPYIVRIKSAMGLYIVPAVAYSDSDCATVYFSRAELVEKWENDRVREATIHRQAMAADSIAERLAEQGRDDDAKFQAAQIADDLRAENKQARNDAHVLIQAIRDQRAIGDIVAPICKALISEIKGLRRDIQRNNKRINELAADYWRAVY